MVRRLEHLTGSSHAPSLAFAVEARDRPGPAFKGGSAPDEEVWVQVSPSGEVRISPVCPTATNCVPIHVTD